MSAQTLAAAKRGELEMSDREFAMVRDRIQALTGICMNETKRTLVMRRLNSRVAATGTQSFAEYLDYVQQHPQQEQQAFCNAVTTNLTAFFREKHHFDYIEQTILPALVQGPRAAQRRLRIWSAGCSTGEEPYTLALTLRNLDQALRGWNVRVLCSDLDTDVVAKAKNGRYPENRFEKVPDRMLRTHFDRSEERGDVFYTAKESLKSLLVFKTLNLMGPWPMKGQFDFIVCRNVMIYFDKPTQAKLVSRFADALAPGGHLIIGHSESLAKVSDRFDLVGNTIYRLIS